MPKGLIFGMFTLIVLGVDDHVAERLDRRDRSGHDCTARSRWRRRPSRCSTASASSTATDVAKLLALFAVIGLIASFHTIIFAYGRQIYSLSRAGYYPAVMSVTHGSRKTPHIALFTGTALGLAVIIAVWFALGAEKGGAVIGATLLNMAVFGAMISYAFQGLSFILLRRKHAEHRAPVSQPARHSRRGR